MFQLFQADQDLRIDGRNGKGFPGDLLARSVSQLQFSRREAGWATRPWQPHHTSQRAARLA